MDVCITSIAKSLTEIKVWMIEIIKKTTQHYCSQEILISVALMISSPKVKLENMPPL